MSILDLTSQLPKYTTILPITKVKVEYRPFQVREERTLLLAKEENKLDQIIDAIGQIIENCTYGKHTIGSLNKIDAEYLFIQIRNKSLGEGVEVNGICKSCKGKTPVLINFENVKVSNADKTKKDLSFQILDNVWITLRYPTIQESMNMDANDGVTALALSLDTIIEGEDVKNALDYSMAERIELVESLTNVQLAKFKTFFDRFPTLFLDVEFTCKCGEVNNVHLEGVESFFR